MNFWNIKSRLSINVPTNIKFINIDYSQLRETCVKNAQTAICIN